MFPPCFFFFFFFFLFLFLFLSPKLCLVVCLVFWLALLQTQRVYYKLDKMSDTEDISVQENENDIIEIDSIVSQNELIQQRPSSASVTSSSTTTLTQSVAHSNSMSEPDSDCDCDSESNSDTESECPGASIASNDEIELGIVVEHSPGIISPGSGPEAMHNMYGVDIGVDASGPGPGAGAVVVIADDDPNMHRRHQHFHHHNQHHHQRQPRHAQRLNCCCSCISPEWIHEHCPNARRCLLVTIRRTGSVLICMFVVSLALYIMLRVIELFELVSITGH
jgi:hypothetical protein